MDTTTALTTTHNAAPATTTPIPAGAAPFAALYSMEFGSTEREEWTLLWDGAVESWLLSQRSPHTRRTYSRAWLMWRTFLWERFAIRHPWLVTSEHVLEWMRSMQEAGHAPSTVANRLAACSSLYEFVISRTIIRDGRELSLFIDAAGNRRANPFRAGNVDRPQVKLYGHSRPIHPDTMLDVFRHIESKPEKTLADLRDYALLLTFYRTGWRAHEVLSMTWGHLWRGDQGDNWIYKWEGKGGKSGDRAIPSRIVMAIIAYLKADGRWAPGQPWHIKEDDYIWRPLFIPGNLLNNDPDAVGENRHITRSTATDILRRRLRQHYNRVLREAGFRARERREEAAKRARSYSLHSLRHSFAHQLYMATRDLLRVSKQLNHSKLEVTRIYIDNLQEPVDDYSALLEAQFGI